jgi:uncharacterized protein (TIGR00730 family)
MNTPSKNEKKATPQDGALVCINIPESKISRDPHTIDELSLGLGAKNQRASRIAGEFDRGLKFVKKYKKSVTFYGSARFKSGNIHYKDARALGFRLANLGYAVITGGGPGIMEAGNRGAMEAGGDSIGLNIELPREQVINPYVTDSLSFFYFFSRKTTMSFSAEAYIFFPGGFGTLDEFFEIVTLIQTKKLHSIPVILVGSDFWNPLQKFIEEVLLQQHGAIDKKDLNLYRIIDDHDEIIKFVESSPKRR